MAVMSRSVFGSGARGYGVLSVVFAAGALGGGLLAARLVRPTLRIVVGAAAIAGVLELAGAVAPTLFAFAMCIAPIAVIAVLFDTTVLAIVQGAAIDTHRARVIALLSTVSMLGATAGGPMLGWFADALNGRAALALGGTVVLVAAGGVGLVAQRTAERRAGVRTTVAMSFSGR
jgi:hypothetical protein